VRETVIEGKAQAFTVDSERRLMQKISQLSARQDLTVAAPGKSQAAQLEPAHVV